MNRILGFLAASLLALLVLVPAVAAAGPRPQDEHLVVNTGGDITLPAGQKVDLLVVVNGTATIGGNATSVVVINGTLALAGARVANIVSISSTIILDGTSVVTGDIRTIQSTVNQSAGSTVYGKVIEGFDLAVTAWVLASALFLAYLGFAIAAVVAALLLAGIASRQVRTAEALIRDEPAMTFLSAFAGFVGILVAGTLAIVTVVGIPLGLGTLAIVLPGLAIIGYLVAGISLGEWIVGRLTPGVRRERPYLAAVVGVVALDIVSIVPPIGGVACLVGFGAVILLIWRTMRGSTSLDRSFEPVAAPLGG
jgi:hypothetical protein